MNINPSLRCVVSPRLIALAAALAIALAASAASAAEPPTPITFLKDTNVKVTDLVDMDVSGEAKTKRDAELRALVGSIIDYDDMAMRSLGKHWEPLTEEQRAQYRTLFKQVVELTYIDRMGQRDKDVDYEIEWESESTKGKRGLAKVWVIYEDTETELDFVLVAKDAGWLLYDLSIDGASLEETYQRNYGKTIEEEGFDKLIERMEERIAELKAS